MLYIHMHASAVQVSMADFTAAFGNLVPSLTVADLDRYDRLQQQYAPERQRAKGLGGGTSSAATGGASTSSAATPEMMAAAMAAASTSSSSGSVSTPDRR